MDKVILTFSVCYFIFFVFYLLYQFEVVDIPESFMIYWARTLDVIETIILITTRFWGFGVLGIWGIGVFYVLNIILLGMQFIFADTEIGQKIIDIFWIAFYVLLFMVDIFDISAITIDTFLTQSFLGKLIIAVLAPVLKTIILHAIQSNK